MKCVIKGIVNMKLQGVETVNMTEVLYLPQEYFERLKACTERIHGGGYQRKNDHQERRRKIDFR